MTADTVNVDTLERTLRDSFYAGITMSPHVVEAALSDLAARAREPQSYREKRLVLRWQEAEADRDRLRAELENARVLIDEEWPRQVEDADRLARRVAELEQERDEAWFERVETTLANGDKDYVVWCRRCGVNHQRPEHCPTRTSGPDWSKCDCGAGPYGIHARHCALAGEGGGPRYGCAPGCRADMDAGLHKPECRVPPAGDGGGA